MKHKFLKRTLPLIICMALPLALLVFLLVMATRSNYLEAATSLGAEFGQAMAEQATQAIKSTAYDDWNVVLMAKNNLPDGFSFLEESEKSAWLVENSNSLIGRSGTLEYYNTDGSYLSGRGNGGKMSFSSRTDISAVMAGSDGAVYGPVYEDESSVAGTNGERSGYVIYYTVPVRNQNNTVVAALSLRRDAYELSDALKGLNVGDDAFTLVVSGDGTIIASSRQREQELVAVEANLLLQGDAYSQVIQEAQCNGSAVMQVNDNELGSVQVLAQRVDVNDLIAQGTLTGYEDETETIKTTDEITADDWVALCCIPQATLLSAFENAQNTGDEQYQVQALSVAIIALLLIYLLLYYLLSRYLERQRKLEEHREILEQSMRAMLRMVNEHGVVDQGHDYRVGAVARALGEHLKLSKQELQDLYFAAVLADVGTVGVSPQAIENLKNQNDSSLDDTTPFRKHVTIGGRILADMDAMTGIDAAVSYHHQNYDGTGYCSDDVRPLKGQNIPLFARIISVANFCDRDRKMETDQLIELLEQGKGSRFDPLIANLMIQLLQDGTFDQLQEEVDDAIRIGRDPLTV